ncbi:CDP-glycerol glycerophosphotransferase family protein [Paeniglutamicibacter gangotriensis]|uniref:CDP-Glycerol:Poly(Glycerophosphate) glycerophosphotransferase n=1 Tax=Paeniglutamicibacter gangotriensis Lz1y TaxID=1276920 RepID=M7NDS2_9MICC|nr:CDP-glycerol glycerophosphotransferase family protein [Paeniglutamicibacter gangotriensis]EMQ99974.1 CDP-Glycerol:Poly(glycerophosphate) glycerophosphotransferase [Paeniglutamicibacter gangotriensis Lz1y]
MKDLSVVSRKVRKVRNRAASILWEPRLRKSLEATHSPHRVNPELAAFFADSADLQYQMTQWITPFERLSGAGHVVAFVIMDPLVARELRKKTWLPILLTRSMAEIEKFVADKNIRGVFYVNNSQSNFTALRMKSPVHVHLNHGESEKSSMVSNQLKAYDYAFIAGDAAEGRIAAEIKRFDRSHLVHIGRPQLDVPLVTEPKASNHQRITVLYAPTWEGDSKDMAYSSLTTVGVRLVQELLADDRFTLLFRPHPKSGSWSREAKGALRTIVGLVKEAARDDPGSRHGIDDSEDPVRTILGSDIVIADVSAMTMDAIGLDKNLILLSPENKPGERVGRGSESRLYTEIPTVFADFKGRFPDLVAARVASGIPASQADYRIAIFGDPGLGSGTSRFIDAVKKIMR